MAGWKTSAKDGSISMNKTAMAIEKITGIDMHDSNGQVRDFYDIMGDIAGMWDKLDKKSKSSVAEAIAGKNQLNVFTAIMSNWSQAQKFLSEYDAGKTIGSSMKEKQHSPYVEKSA